MSDRSPSERIEAAVLGSCLRGQIAAVLEQAPAPFCRWFFHRKHQRIAESMARLTAAGQPIDEMALAADLDAHAAGQDSADAQVDLTYLAALADFGSSDSKNAGAVAAQLRHAKQRRDATAILANAVFSLKEGATGADPTKTISEAIAAVRGLEIDAGADRNVGEAIRRAVDDGLALADLRSRGMCGNATWGVQEIDTLCPFEPGRLYVLAAAPKCGKTSLAITSAIATADALAESGGKVALASLEMSGPEIATILAARMLGFPAASLRNGTLEEYQLAQVRELAEAWDAADAMWIRDAGVSSAGSATCDAIISWLHFRQQASGGKMALAVIDYLQIMDPSNPRNTEYQTISENTRKLKRAAQLLKVPILLLSQMNRDGRRQTMGRGGEAQGQVEPTLGALRGSGSIEQDADAILFLHQPEAGKQEVRIIRATLAASRYCDTGTLDLQFHGPTQTFRAIPPPEAPPALDLTERDRLGDQIAAGIV